MARSKITDDQWEKAREYFEHGLSLSDIEKRTGITRGAISKKSKTECWDKESPKKQLLSQAVEVSAAKETLKKHPVSYEVHEELHDERTRQLIYFQNSAMWNQEKANEAIKDVVKSSTPKDALYALQTHTAITAKNKETVLGKETASTTVNVQNNNTAVSASGDEVSDAIRRKFNS